MGGQHKKQRLMKDGLGSTAVQRLAANLAIGQEAFDAEAFLGSACAGLEKLELKARVTHIAGAMATHLPGDYPEALAGILRSLPSWDRGPSSDNLRGFASWPVFAFIEEQGGKHAAISLDALAALTHLFTAEFAVRPFLIADQRLAMQKVTSWTKHSSEQVRRLASEGIRPRLPWAGRLPAFQENPEPVLQVLEMLKDDEAEFVRRSVGNCLADVAVDHPDLVIERCKKWMRGASPARKWIVKRGTRNLIKSGHPGVWSLHGYTTSPALRVEGLSASPNRVSLGQKFSLDFVLHSRAKSSQRLVVDFVVHHVKASGQSSSKVFKLRELELGAGETLEFSKTHVFRSITTRVYYPGRHRIEVQINGERYGETSVELSL